MRGAMEQVERYNKTLKTALRAISIDKDTDFSKGNGWHLYVPYINSITNSRKSRRTQYKLSPAEIFLGRSPQTPIEFKLFGLESVKKKSGGSKYAEWITDQIKINQTIASEALAIYDAKRKAAYDENRVPVTFKVGDRIKIWRGQYPAKGSSKLKINWDGPWIIRSAFNDGLNYKVQHEESPDKHDVCNVKMMSSYKSEPSADVEAPHGDDSHSLDTHSSTSSSLSWTSLRL